MEQNHRKKARRRTGAAALLLAAWLCCIPVRAQALSLVPVGRPVGIRLTTPGALVVGLTKTQFDSPAAAAGLRAGDLITSVQGKPVGSAADFLAAAAEFDGSEVLLTAERGGKTLSFRVRPQKMPDGWALGVWLRDSISGIGTVTFYDPETGYFGALGHPINDVDTGVLLPVGSGEITDAEVVGIRKGQCGTPGELCGSPDAEAVCGSVLHNTPCGIFGYLHIDGAGEALPVADESEIRTGSACILSNVQGREVAAYAIEIEQVHHGGTRTLCFRVTDETLLDLTGGIVQGMSGSPILQDGRLIGAVTHVLVNDPTRGYGISIGQMLEAGREIPQSKAA